MRTRTILAPLITLLGLLITTRTATPCTFAKIPQRDIVRGSPVIVFATVEGIRGPVGMRFADFKIQEVLKGEINRKSLEVPFKEKAEGPCDGTITYAVASEYILFLQRKGNRDDVDYFKNLRVSNRTTVENLKRFVRINETEDLKKWTTLYLEIFRSGEFEFLMEAHDTLRKIGFDDNVVLETTLLDHWVQLAKEEWKRSHLIRPLVDIDSQKAIPHLIEMARYGGSWNFRIDAIRALMELHATETKDLLLEISRTDPDFSVRREALAKVGKLLGTDAGTFLIDTLMTERDSWTRATLLNEISELNHPATFDLAVAELSRSRTSWDKHEVCKVLAKLKDKRAYPILAKEFDAVTDVGYRDALAEALVAIDGLSAYQLLLPMLDGRGPIPKLRVVQLLAKSRSLVAYQELQRLLTSEVAAITSEVSNDPEKTWQIGAIVESLIAIDPTKAEVAVLPLTKHSNSILRYRITHVIGVTKMQWAFERLVEMLSDNEVSSVAAESLLEIDYERGVTLVLESLKTERIPLTPDLREIFAEHREQRSLAMLERELRRADADGDDFLRSVLKDAIIRIQKPRTTERSSHAVRP